MGDNRLQKSLEDTYFEGGKDYQFGGYVPGNSVNSSYISFTLQNPNPFSVGVLYTDFCGEYKATTITPFSTSGFCIDTKYSYQIPITLNVISSGTTCSQFCPSPTPTPTASITPSISSSPIIPVSPSQTATPSLTATPSISATPNISQTPTPSITPTISITPSITPTITTTPSLTPPPTPSPSSSPPAPEPVSMTIVGTGNFSGFTGTWKPSQKQNKLFYSLQGGGSTYDYYKFKTYGAQAMVFFKTTEQKMLWWRFVSNNVIPCYNIGGWNFERTFSHYPTYPVETWIGVYKNPQAEYFCGGVNQINGLGWPGEGTYTRPYGSVVITYNYPP